MSPPGSSVLSIHFATFTIDYLLCYYATFKATFKVYRQGVLGRS